MKQSLSETEEETFYYKIEDKAVFSRSLLWDLQRDYYAVKGIEAWRQGEVPHYVTSNPTIAYSYAEIVFAFLQDTRSLTIQPELQAPLTICELGAGHGRFAYHFLKRLTELCGHAQLPLTSFRYVITDFTQGNLDFWRKHPNFQPYFQSGILDIALFDINESTELSLQLSGAAITPGSLHTPIVVIANYVFDSVPQELLYIKDRQCDQCLLSLYVDEEPDRLSVPELLAKLYMEYDYERISQPAYGETYLQELLELYRDELAESHLLFPAVSLACLERLRAWSKEGLLLLTADKGDHRPASLQHNAAPGLVLHGSFSFNVNYDAFKRYCERSGGTALFPNRQNNSVNYGCLLMVDKPSLYTLTALAYRRHFFDYGPDDFYTISKHISLYSEKMSLKEILAYIRLSHYDAQQLAQHLPRLMELADEAGAHERLDLKAVIRLVWETYYPLGEEADLAFRLGSLFYAMDDYSEALYYLQKSDMIYGKHTGTLYNMALCHRMLGEEEEADRLLAYLK